jgi:hypothetical protein
MGGVLSLGRLAAGQAATQESFSATRAAPRTRSASTTSPARATNRVRPAQRTAYPSPKRSLAGQAAATTRLCNQIARPQGADEAPSEGISAGDVTFLRALNQAILDFGWRGRAAAARDDGRRVPGSTRQHASRPAVPAVDLEAILDAPEKHGLAAIADVATLGSTGGEGLSSMLQRAASPAILHDADARVGLLQALGDLRNQLTRRIRGILRRGTRDGLASVSAVDTTFDFPAFDGAGSL